MLGGQQFSLNSNPALFGPGPPGIVDLSMVPPGGIPDIGSVAGAYYEGSRKRAGGPTITSRDIGETYDGSARGEGTFGGYIGVLREHGSIIRNIPATVSIAAGTHDLNIMPQPLFTGWIPGQPMFSLGFYDEDENSGISAHILPDMTTVGGKLSRLVNGPQLAMLFQRAKEEQDCVIADGIMDPKTVKCAASGGARPRVPTEPFVPVTPYDIMYTALEVGEMPKILSGTRQDVADVADVIGQLTERLRIAKSEKWQDDYVEYLGGTRNLAILYLRLLIDKGSKETLDAIPKDHRSALRELLSEKKILRIYDLDDTWIHGLKTKKVPASPIWNRFGLPNADLQAAILPAALELKVPVSGKTRDSSESSAPITKAPTKKSSETVSGVTSRAAGESIDDLKTVIDTYPELFWLDSPSWKEAALKSPLIRWNNIKYIRENLRFLGFLETATPSDKYCLVDVAVVGHCRTFDYWAPDRSAGDDNFPLPKSMQEGMRLTENVGFMVKRKKAGERFELYPWRDMSQSFPKPEELRYDDPISGLKGVDGVYFSAGIIQDMDMRFVQLDHNGVPVNRSRMLLGYAGTPEDVQSVYEATRLTIGTQKNVTVSVGPWKGYVLSMLSEWGGG